MEASGSTTSSHWPKCRASPRAAEESHCSQSTLTRYKVANDANAQLGYNGPAVDKKSNLLQIDMRHRF